MFRIKNQETVEKLRKVFSSYTNDDREVLSKITHGVLFGYRFRVDAADVVRYSTEEGITAQIDKFGTTIGLIYYLTVENGKPEIHKMAVEIRHPVRALRAI